MAEVTRPVVRPRRSYFPTVIAILSLLTMCLTTACGSGKSAPTVPGNSQVTVALTSAANDQLVFFDMVLNTMTLTEQSGNTATLIPAAQGFEFIQRNGQLAPGFTVTVQQGTYVSATATVGGAEFDCVVNLPGSGLWSATYAYGYTPNSQVSVSLPAPITISGSNAGLWINLDVSQSALFPSDCVNAQGTSQWSITPTFTITPFELSQTPTNAQNGAVQGLVGEITAIGTSGNSFTLAAAEADATADPVTINTSNNTAYQGIGNFSGLAVGTFVNMDGALQEDSSVLASRIGVEYPSAVDTVTGPVIFIADSEKALFLEGVDEQGSDYANMHVLGAQPFSFDNAVFQISGQLTNLQDLPFVPSFSSSNMVPGQNVSLSSPALTDMSNPYTELDAITLIPQTIDGTVTASAPSGSFTDYSVSLKAYDLFPNLAGQPGQAVLLNDPSDVEVYVDGSTQMVNTQNLSVGNTFRFYGLVFNDNGTLRMDCAQISDGVGLTAQTPVSQISQKLMGEGEVRQVFHRNVGPVPQTITVNTRNLRP